MWPRIRKDREREERARRYTDEAMLRADEIMDRVKGRMFSECFTDHGLATRVANAGPKLVLSFELQFLWGFFHEFVQTEEFPTNGYDRIKLHLLHRLVRVHGYELKEATAEANAVEDLFNEDDPLFREISRLGMLSFHAPVDEAMVLILRAIDETGWKDAKDDR